MLVVVVVVVVLTHWRFFIHCFSTSSLTFPWVIARFLHPFYIFSPVRRKVVRNTFIWTFLGFYVTVLPGVLQLWASVFYLALVPQILARFCDSDASRNTPSSVPALTGLSLLTHAWSWTTHIVDKRPLVYPLHKKPTKYRVIKLLNMFLPTYACSKS